MSKTLVVVVCVVLAACGKKEEKVGSGPRSAAAGGTAPASAAGDCLVGTYELTDLGKLNQMIFNADKTGVDSKEDGKKQDKFTWSLKDDHTVHMVYPREGDSVGGQFDMPFNCADGTFYTLYKKKR